MAAIQLLDANMMICIEIQMRMGYNKKQKSKLENQLRVLSRVINMKFSDKKFIKNTELWSKKKY